MDEFLTRKADSLIEKASEYEQIESVQEAALFRIAAAIYHVGGAVVAAIRSSDERANADPRTTITGSDAVEPVGCPSDAAGSREAEAELTQSAS